MIPGVVAVLIAIACGLFLFFVRRGATPPASMFAETRSAILDLQLAASHNIVPCEPAQKVTGIDQDQMLRQSCHVGDTIRYVYTIEESDDGVIHTISSQLIKPKTEKYQVQCMLVAMLTLNQCLGDSGIDPKTIEFKLYRSEMGTHYVEMTLSREEHDRIMADRMAAQSACIQRI